MENEMENENEKAIELIYRGYVECAMWLDEGNEDNFIGQDYNQTDLAPEAISAMRADCAKFYAENKADIEAALPALRPKDHNPLEVIGHDFWLTRNHHGAGFWDGDYPDEIGERLTKASHGYPECSLYVGDDGLIYYFNN